MPRKRTVDVDKLFRDGTPIDRAVARGVYEAMETHVRFGVEAIAWDGKKVVRIPVSRIKRFLRENRHLAREKRVPRRG